MSDEEMRVEKLRALKNNALMQACSCMFADLFDRAERAERKVNGSVPVSISIDGSIVIEGTLGELFEVVQAVQCASCTGKCQENKEGACNG